MQDIYFPWWGYCYLGVLVGLTIWGAPNERDRKYGSYYLVGEVVSLGVTAACIFAYVNSSVAEIMGLFLLALVFVGTAFEFANALHSLRHVEYDEELSKKENQLSRVFGVVIGGVVVLPGYVMGALAWLRTTNV